MIKGKNVNMAAAKSYNADGINLFKPMKRESDEFFLLAQFKKLRTSKNSGKVTGVLLKDPSIQNNYPNNESNACSFCEMALSTDPLDWETCKDCSKYFCGSCSTIK